MKVTRRAALVGGASSIALLAMPARLFGTGAAESIEALIGRMTIEEKAGQLSIFPAALASAPATAANPATVAGSEQEQAEAVRQGRIGALFNGSNADWHGRMQRVATAESRLKIPLLFAADVIHGFHTVFPVPLGEAAAFDVDLAERTARAAAVEATAAGIAWNFAPMVDIARDQRWGRTVEGAGEDVLLGRRLAEARVRGFQGTRGLAHRQAMAATPKHLAAYGAAIGGLDYNSVDVSERTLREVYFPPFQAGFAARAPCTMASFNDIAGVPAHANPWLLRDMLRGEWGFDGLVVSDFAGDEELIAHGFAADKREAARLALIAGVDMSMASGLYRDHIPDLVRGGAVPVARVDEAVRRVLALKHRLGLFDAPLGRPRGRKPGDAPAFRPLAREAARRSIVMLRNEGVLPLRKDARIALIGPFADGVEDINGPWVLFAERRHSVGIADGLRRAMADPRRLTVTRGSDAEAPIPGGLDAAVAAAHAADVVVLAIGEHEKMSGEAQSRTEIVVPAPQQALAEALAATGKPVVVLLKTGRGLALEGAVAQADALLVCWFLGTETGPAIADILFGDHAPSGRLPVSFPNRSGQSPYHYDHKPTGRPSPPDRPDDGFKARYRETLNAAAFPFGHGLTYGDVAYDAIEVSGPLAWDGAVTVGAQIANRGSRAADELVQLYVRDRAASVTRPVRQLKDFRRVTLAPGESRRVRFTLSRQDLLFVGRDLRWTVEPGTFDVWIAPSAQAGVGAQFELLGPATAAAPAPARR